MNHSVTELVKLVDRLEERAKTQKGGRDAFKDARTLARAMAEETGGDASKDPKTALTAHVLATFNADVRTLEAQANELEEKAPGLFLAGIFRDGISLSDSIVSGHNVAERIQNYLSQKSPEGPATPPGMRTESAASLIQCSGQSRSVSFQTVSKPNASSFLY